MKAAFAAAAVAAALGAAVWFGLHQTAYPPEFVRDIDSLSYNVAAPEEHGSDAKAIARQLREVDRDLKLLTGVTRSVRLYAASGLYESIPAIARGHGLSVTAGAWVSREQELSRRELDAAIRAANRNANVHAVAVGNETVLRSLLSVRELVAMLRYVRQRVRVAVTTGETWNIWLEYPELAREVDYISAHILPYWEGVPAKAAIEFTFARYEDLRRAYPGKRIVIAEFGWPSRGSNNRSAYPSQLAQANLIREFLTEAHRRGVAYNIIEAIDQPWKTSEGSVGLYWGIYDTGRKPKFLFEGRVQEQNYWMRAALAVATGFLVPLAAFAAMHRRPTFLHALAVAVASQALASGVAMAVLYPFENYLSVSSALAWAIGLLLMLPLTAMTLLRVHEVAEVTLGHPPKRLIEAPVLPREGWREPLVSIHIPAYRESPRMLIETLDSVAALDYPRFEALVIVNNTPEEALWRPVEEHCRRLGDRFKFVLLPKVAGFKAGALNAALPWMAPEAEVIALIDSDYVVGPDWLKHLVPAFADPAIGIVQAPQDHRDDGGSFFKRAMNSEYAGFFDIGMVQRNEDDAIITHGTMLLVRRAAFEAVGGWSTDTITEDTEFGLRLLRAGYLAVYTNRRYGWGLLPDTFKAFQTQRDRWAYGAVQIIRKHWRAMLPGDRSLTRAQKFQFVAGWSFWFADAFGVVAALLNLLWVPLILFVGMLIPMLPFTLPILAMFVVNILHCSLLYAVRVKLPARRILGAALAAMSLQMTVARAIAKGFFRGGLPFLRTEKGGLTGRGTQRPGKERVAWVEGLVGLALALGAVVLYATNEVAMVELNFFAATLAVQCLPFLAAPAMVLLERLLPALPQPDPPAAPKP
jgi:exo-beta-1,3-glucanase (GH17 family)/glycosyltransferase involved in cell wall biosynthesis